MTQVTDKREALAADLQAILPLLDNAIRTLEISPDNEFPSAAPPALASFPGVLIAYDPDLSGEISFEKTPAIWIASDGSTRYLDAVPDKIQIEFSGHESLSQPASLLIQPIRDGQNRFFEAIPADLQGLVSDLEIRFSNDNNVSNKEKTLEHMLTFNRGLGFRQIREARAPAGAQDPPHLTYHFEGVTQDGLYYVQFDDPIHLTGSVDEVVLNANAPESAAFLNVLAQLDGMVQSLSISPDASIYSSVPINPSDCTNNAQFITDVTIPDHTLIERGETFTKKWLVRNTGTCSWTPKYKIALGGGNPLTWSNAAISVVVPPEQEIELSVKVLSPEVPGNYQAWWRLTDENGEPFGASFSVQFETPRPATDIPGYGVVEGSLSYPAGGMPAMTIYFLHTDGSQRYALETEQGWTRYANEIPAGEYYVFARVSGDESDTGGGFTEAAVCELMCEDHTLVEVMIEEGKATREVNILDWYAPAGTFPLPAVSP